jgi:hypothetical protein
MNYLARFLSVRQEYCTTGDALPLSAPIARDYIDSLRHWRDYNGVSITAAVRLAILLEGHSALTLGTNDPPARLMYVHRDRLKEPIAPARPPEQSGRTIMTTVHLHPEILGLLAFSCVAKTIEPSEVVHNGLSMLQEVGELSDYIPDIIEGDPSGSYTAYPIDPARRETFDRIQASRP